LKTCKLIVPHKRFRKTSIPALCLNSVWETGLVSQSLQKDMRWPYSTKYASDFRETPAWNTNLSHLRKDLRTEAIHRIVKEFLQLKPRWFSRRRYVFDFDRKSRGIFFNFLCRLQKRARSLIETVKKKKREKWQPDTTIVTMLLGIWYRPITSATRRITGKKFNSETGFTDITFCVENNS